MPELVIKDGLKRGMRNSSDTDRNSERLVNCYNVKPNRYGLTAHSPISFPSALSTAISGEGLSVSHPFPQIFRGATYTLLFSETRVFTVNESTWGLTEETIYDLSDVSTTIASGGGAWQFADFGDSWWAFNGVTTLVRSNVGGNTRVRADTASPTQTGCAFRGRVVWGGFDENNYWNGDWDTFHEYLTNQHISSPSGLSPDGLRSNCVSWCSIGGG